MEKIFFNQLAIEITRRCQLKCAHCLRGEAQDLDISPEYINTLLDQTAGILNLFFTGGEPTLNVGIMKYILLQVKQRNIPIGGIGFVTNGFGINEELFNVLSDYLEYIRFCRNEYISRFACIYTHYNNPALEIRISDDMYHRNSYTEITNKHYPFFVSDAIRKYRSRFDAEDCLIRTSSQNIVLALGRAKSLVQARDATTDSYYANRQIGLYSKENISYSCESIVFSRSIFQYCDYFIPCILSLAANGILMFREMEEYGTEEESKVCALNQDSRSSIVDEIKKLNANRPPCYIVDNIPKAITKRSYDAYYYWKLRPYKTKLKALPNYINNEYNRPNLVKHIRDAVSDSRRKFGERFVQYLTDRVKCYADINEIKKDFQFSNDDFIDAIHDKIQNADNLEMQAATIARWIFDNKDYVKYRVTDEALNAIIANNDTLILGATSLDAEFPLYDGM